APGGDPRLPEFLDLPEARPDRVAARHHRAGRSRGGHGCVGRDDQLRHPPALSPHRVGQRPPPAASLQRCILRPQSAARCARQGRQDSLRLHHRRAIVSGAARHRLLGSARGGFALADRRGGGGGRMTQALQALILGIVEGATEFVPVSSTGHLIIAADWLDYPEAERATFEIFIQMGAILAVFWHYRRDLLELARRAAAERPAQELIGKVLLAFLPAAAGGFLLRRWIEAHLCRL